VRRTLSLIFSVVALAGLVSACGGDDDTTESGLGSSSDTSATDGDGHDDMDDGHMDDDGRDHAVNTPVAPGARRIELSGRSYAFDPPEITVRAGEDVAIVLTATDIEHDFTVDDLEAHVSAGAAETAEGGLRADHPGSYSYYCSVEGHRDAGMEGTLIVEPA
jgi:plastocyanin/predicted small secreted protein